MNFKKKITVLLVLTFLCLAFCACDDTDVLESTYTEELTATVDIAQGDSETTEQELPSPVTSIDINTSGGAVIIGKINVDEQGWYIIPEQPLNVTYEAFFDKFFTFPEQTRIKMFDPSIDGIEKATYIGQTVTVEGTFRFYRDDFETLYFVPYIIRIGKNADNSYGAPDLLEPTEPENLYDPSVPLPKKMDTVIVDGAYFYNAFMLSRETLEYMGNDFATFYVEFVDAFLNYEEECPCPNKEYAEMLSTIIYYEFPLYNACAESFNFFKNYNPERGTVSISYKYGREEHDRIMELFFSAANELLALAKPEQSDAEKAKNIYHALCTRMIYDYSALEDLDRKESHYAYLNNSGVCVTFANVYNQLLTQVGIQTTVANCDNEDTIGHSWSIVTLNGKQYFCDPTYELSYDNGNGYKFYGMNYADRIADGTGKLGILYGRYYDYLLYADMIAEHSLSR